MLKFILLITLAVYGPSVKPLSPDSGVKEVLQFWSQCALHIASACRFPLTGSPVQSCAEQSSRLGWNVWTSAISCTGSCHSFAIVFVLFLSKVSRKRWRWKTKEMNSKWKGAFLLLTHLTVNKLRIVESKGQVVFLYILSFIYSPDSPGENI